MARLRLRVKEVAEAKGISMTKLSQRSEVSYNIIRDIFRNPFRSTQTETLQRIADVLGVNVAELLETVED